MSTVFPEKESSSQQLIIPLVWSTHTKSEECRYRTIVFWFKSSPFILVIEALGRNRTNKNRKNYIKVTLQHMPHFYIEASSLPQSGHLPLDPIICRYINDSAKEILFDMIRHTHDSASQNFPLDNPNIFLRGWGLGGGKRGGGGYCYQLTSTASLRTT